jgi:hypothetical protein
MAFKLEAGTGSAFLRGDASWVAGLNIEWHSNP